LKRYEKGRRPVPYSQAVDEDSTMIPLLSEITNERDKHVIGRMAIREDAASSRRNTGKTALSDFG
jgi:hypothetical protein